MSSESSINSDAPAGRDVRWGVFSNLAFTVILIASSASNVGFAMFDMSSNWLMTSLNPDPMMVSAVQVATTLPMFLLTLPAGALTDIIDARRLLIGAQLAVTAISIVFAAVGHDCIGRRRLCCLRPPFVSAGAERSPRRRGS